MIRSLQWMICIGFFSVFDASAQQQPKFESISEMDLSYFLTNPKLPWGSDPFYRKPGFALVNEPDEASQFKLAGILYSKNVPLAVINGETVRKGDRIGDRLVTEIGENFVILKKKSSEIELTLPPLLNWGDDEGADEEEDGSQ